MEYRELFKVELTEINSSYVNQQDLFQNVAAKLVSFGFVKETFSHAILTREKCYPTGLEMDAISVAIPHTDVEHVIEPFVYVVKLKTPLEFIKMGTTNDPLLVTSVFILGIKQPKEQVGLLSGFMELLQNQWFIQTFERLDNVAQVNELIKLHFRSGIK